MSVYSQYATNNVNTSDIVANENYVGLGGAFQMISESAENEHAIFEAVIGQDFAEAYNKINPAAVTESDIMAIQEANGKGIWSKVVDFVRRIGEKIMGIIKTLRDRIQSVFIRDGKELVKKYKSQVNSASNTGKLAKMKYSYAKPQGAGVGSGKTLETAITGTKLMTALDLKFDLAAKAITIKPAGDNDSGYDSKVGAGEGFKPYTSDEKTDFLNDALAAISGTSSDSKTFNKDFDESIFKDVEEMEGLDTGLISDIIATLEGTKGAIKELDKNEKATKKTIKDIEVKAKKTETDCAKKLGESSPAKNSVVRINATAGQVITLCNIYSNVAGHYYGALGSAIKKDLKQCRSIFIKAATYSHKQSANEQTEWLTAVGEVSDYEVNEMFDNAE